MATTYTSSSGSSWNTDIAATLAQKQKANPNINYVSGYDVNGQLHYAKNQNALNKIISAVPEGATSYTRDAAYGGQTYNLYQEPQVDYSAILSSLMGIYQNSAQQQQQAYDNAQKANDEQINNMYDMSARDYYKLYKKQSAMLPTQLSRVGATGGASETSQLSLLNGYGANIQANENARNNNLSNSAISANEKKAQASADAASKMANFYYQMAMQKYADDRDAKEKADAQALLNEVNKWNNSLTDNIKAQLDKGKTVYTWTDNMGKNHWSTSINQAQASGYNFTPLYPNGQNGTTKNPTPDDGGNKLSTAVGDKVINEINTLLQRAPAGMTESQLANAVNNIISQYDLNDATVKYILANYGL